MAEETPATQPAMVGCNFDAATAEATAGKDVLLCITDPNTADLLARSEERRVGKECM